MRVVALQVTSDHGDAVYACPCRFRVHGAEAEAGGAACGGGGGA